MAKFDTFDRLWGHNQLYFNVHALRDALYAATGDSSRQEGIMQRFARQMVLYDRLCELLEGVEVEYHFALENPEDSLDVSARILALTESGAIDLTVREYFDEGTGLSSSMKLHLKNAGEVSCMLHYAEPLLSLEGASERDRSLWAHRRLLSDEVMGRFFADAEDPKDEAEILLKNDDLELVLDAYVRVLLGWHTDTVHAMLEQSYRSLLEDVGFDPVAQMTLWPRFIEVIHHVEAARGAPLHFCVRADVFPHTEVCVVGWHRGGEINPDLKIVAQADTHFIELHHNPMLQSLFMHADGTCELIEAGSSSCFELEAVPALINLCFKQLAR